MIAVIDYGMGNLRSVAKALESAGANEVKLSSDAGIIQQADKIVLPGVGAIKEAMRELKRLGLIKVINKNIFKKPFLGICLGLQLLFERSEEGGRVRGLGVFKGTVRRFPDKLKVPHMGWNQVRQQNAHALWSGIEDDTRFYFVHSYYAQVEDEQMVSGVSDYGLPFTCAVARDNIFAVQFHPEKSHTAGLRMLRNFVDWKL